MDAMGIELGEQPGVWSNLWGRRPGLRAALEALLRGRAPDRVVITGCGDCHAAAEWAEWLVELRTRVPVRGLAAMELTRGRAHLLGPGTLLVALSVSGSTPRVIEAVRTARAAGARVLGITDNPASVLAREPEAVFVLGTAPPEALGRTDYRDPEAARYGGYHRAVPQTKTFGAMQLALVLLCLALEELSPSGRGTPRETLEPWLRRLPELAARARPAAEDAARGALEGARPRARAAFSGTGPNAPTARFLAYKMLELVLPAGHAEIEEYCHTLYLVTGAGDIAVFLAHDRGTLERVGEIAPVLEGEIGAAVQVLSTAPAPEPPPPWLVRLPTVPPEVSPLILAFAGSCWARALARGWGVNTDRFRAGVDEERYVRGSTRMVRGSAIRGG